METPDLAAFIAEAPWNPELPEEAGMILSACIDKLMRAGGNLKTIVVRGTRDRVVVHAVLMSRSPNAIARAHQQARATVVFTNA